MENQTIHRTRAMNMRRALQRENEFYAAVECKLLPFCMSNFLVNKSINYWINKDRKTICTWIAQTRGQHSWRRLLNQSAKSKKHFFDLFPFFILYFFLHFIPSVNNSMIDKLDEKLNDHRMRLSILANSINKSQVLQ